MTEYKKQEIYTDVEFKAKNPVVLDSSAAPDWKNSFSITAIEYHDFVKKMKVYPKEHAIVYPTLGMMGEAGEASEKVKKWLRDDKELDKVELIKELGDVAWYIAALADDLGFTFDDVLRRNIEKLSKRKEDGVLKGSGDNR